MWRQRYDNEALYPCNGPAVRKLRSCSMREQKSRFAKVKAIQLKMQLKTAYSL